MTVKKTLVIPRELFDPFKKRHPSHGSFVWFVRTALEKYNELNDIDPEELVRLAVGEIDLKD